MRSIFVFLTLVIATTCYSQQAVWMKYSDASLYDYSYGRRMVSHPNGSIYVLGQMYGAHSFDGIHLTTPDGIYRDVFLARYTTNGDLIWVKQIIQSDPTTYGDNRVIDIKVDSQGDLILVGTSFSPSSFLGAPEGSGVFIAKMDQDANYKWIHYDSNISTADSDVGRSGNRIVIDSDDNIIWYTDQNREPSYGNYTGGLALIKLAPDGTRLWNKFITTNTTFFHPGLTDISLDREGNFIVSGNFITRLFFNGYGALVDNSHNHTNRLQLFIAKISSGGELVWVKQSNYGYTSSNISAHTVDTNNNVYLAAQIGSEGQFGIGSGAYYNPGPTKNVLIRLNPAGEVQWVEPVTGMLSHDATQGKDGFLYFSGIYYNEMHYQSFYAQSEFSQSIILKISTWGSFLGAYTSEGIEDPSTSIGSSSSALQSMVDNQGNIYTIGKFDEGIRFGCLPLTIPGSSFYMVKHDVSNAPQLETTGPQATFCDAATITLTSSVIPNATLYTWNLPRGVTPVSGTNQTYTNTIEVQITPDADEQDVIVIVSTPCGFSFSKPYKIKIKRSPSTPVFNQPETEVCPGTSKLFSVNASENVHTWVATTGIAITPDIEGDEVQLAFAENFSNGTVTVTEKNFCGEGSATINIKAFPGVTKPLLTGSETVCTNFNVIEKSIEPVPNAISYEWSLPEFIIPHPLYPQNTPSLQAQVFPGFTGGSIRVRAIGICTPGEFSDPVEITPFASPSTATDLTGPDKICLNNDGHYSVLPIANAIQYEWEVPAIFSPNGKLYTTSNSITLQSIAEGTGELTVQGANICDVKSNSATIEIESIQPLTQPRIEKSICDTELHVHDAETPTWYINGIATTFSDKSITPLDSGSYYVQVENFCGIEKSHIVNIYPVIPENLVLPNVVTPNGDGRNDSFILDKSISNSSLSIFNRWGKIIYSNENYLNNWSPTELPAGTYYYTLSNSCLPKPYRGWIQVIH